MISRCIALPQKKVFAKEYEISKDLETGIVSVL